MVVVAARVAAGEVVVGLVPILVPVVGLVQVAEPLLIVWTQYFDHFYRTAKKEG